MEARFTTLFFAGLICFNMTFPQEMRSDKGDWIFSSQIGFASLEAENLIKTSANTVENSIGRTLILGKKASIVFSIQHLNISADYRDQNGMQHFLNNIHLSLPIAYQLTYQKDRHFSFDSGLGLYGSYLLQSKLENSADNRVVKQNGLGWNFGFELYFDAVFKLNNSLAMIIGLKTKSDVFDSYKSGLQNYLLTNAHAIRFGLKWRTLK